MKFLPAGKLLLDTSVYIRYAREGALGWIAEDRAAIKRTVLTVVVAAELYAGVRHLEAKRHLDALCRGHRTLGTLSCRSPRCGSKRAACSGATHGCMAASEWQITSVMG